MNRSTLTALVIMGSPLLLSAQKPAAQTVAVRGCVERAQRDGSLSVATDGTTATPNSAPIEANSGELVNSFHLKDATPVDDKAATGRTEYVLQGSTSELAKHVGHSVEIAGTLLPSVADLQSDKARAAEGIRRVQVTGVKMVASKCATKP
jgi:hypothetical protein